MIPIHTMDLRQADLGLLIALDVLLAERSVTRAADRLGLSQPATSAQLARLRDLFDDPLLVATGKRMVPTSRALELQEPLRRLLNDLTALASGGVNRSDATRRSTSSSSIARHACLASCSSIARRIFGAASDRLRMVGRLTTRCM